MPFSAYSPPWLNSSLSWYPKSGLWRNFAKFAIFVHELTLKKRGVHEMLYYLGEFGEISPKPPFLPFLAFQENLWQNFGKLTIFVVACISGHN